MRDYKINIIILNWNGWEDTISCVNSLQKSNCTESFKITVIDNNSSDDSVENIRTACPNIELIQNESNLGFGGGCNIGLLRAIEKGTEFVWLINNDATVYPDTLQNLLNTAYADSITGIIGSVLYCMDAPEKIQSWGGGYINFWTGRVKHIHEKKDARKLQYITGASMLIRVKALREVGVFDDSSYFMYWEDTDLCFRFVRNGWTLAVAEESRVLHKESASFKNKNYLLVRYFNQSAVQFFCKFYRFCFIPVLVGLSGRSIKRILHKDYAGLKEIILVFRHQFTNTFLRVFK